MFESEKGVAEIEQDLSLASIECRLAVDPRREVTASESDLPQALLTRTFQIVPSPRNILESPVFTSEERN